MQRTSFLVGVAFAATATFAVFHFTPRADAEVPAPTVAATWPPAAQDIVNLDGEFTYPVAKGAAQVLFTVPADRWLVITDVSAQSDGRLTESVGDASTTKIGQQFFYSSPLFAMQDRWLRPTVGFSFHPGSKVVLEIDGHGTADGTDVSRYNLSGYLTAR